MDTPRSGALSEHLRRINIQSPLFGNLLSVAPSDAYVPCRVQLALTVAAGPRISTTP